MTYTISQDKSLLDVDYIHAFLRESYWSPGIPRAVVEQGIAGAICFGMYDGARQVGFARLITDRASFAYLADVFIDPALQGRGLGKQLVGHIMGLDFMAGLRRIMLGTRDAHGLYAQYGFKPLAKPERMMEVARPDLYRQD
jgi:GNAT superfamily N-acetyltransferase